MSLALSNHVNRGSNKYLHGEFGSVDGGIVARSGADGADPVGDGQVCLSNATPCLLCKGSGRECGRVVTVAGRGFSVTGVTTGSPQVVGGSQ